MKRLVAARSARLAAASLLVAGIALFTGGATADAYGTRHPIPGSTTACTANGTSYAQSISYSKTINVTGCNQVQARMRYNNGTTGNWYNGGSGTATATSSSNTVVGGGHRRCSGCATYNT